MGLFGPMKPSRILKKATDGILAYKSAATANDEAKKAESLEKINKNFNRMTDILYKKKEGEEASARALQLVTDLSHSDFILLGVKNIPLLPTEQRKQFTFIFTASVVHQTGSEYPVVAYVMRNIEILDTLLRFYDHPELAITAGEMLRVCAHNPVLARELLQPKRLDILISYFNVSHFDVSSDSYATFKELIFVSPYGEEFINENAKTVIEKLQSTLAEASYASCTQSLQLIHEIVNKYPTFKKEYISDEKNLVVAMKLMTSQYKNISMEAFQLFTLFVLPDERPEPVTNILRTNQEALTSYVKALLEGIDDQKLQEEKDALLMKLAFLKN